MNVHDVRRLAGGLAFAAFATLLAACSGQSQVSPAGGVARAPQGGTMAASLLAPSSGTFQPTGDHCISSQGAFLFANDYKTGTVDEFCEDGVLAPPHHNTLFAFCTGCGGWGLAVSPTSQALAIGTSAGTVTLWNVAANGTVTPQNSTLTLDGGVGTNFPLGICFDGTGGLYATNYGTNKIDYFNAATLVSPGGNPTGSWSTTKTTLGYFLACDFDGPTGENYLMLSGELLKNNVYDFVLSQVVNGAPPVGNVVIADLVVRNFGPSPNALAGGLTINKKDNLVVADENGTLYEMGTSEPWANIIAKCTDKPYISGISFDETQDEIWSSFDTVVPATEVISNQFPFAPAKKCKTGTSRGPAVPSMGEKEYLGIAVYPNTGV